MTSTEIYRLSSIGEIARLINSGSDLETILDRVTYGLCRHSSWAMSGIMVIDKDSGFSEVVRRFDPYTTGSTRAPLRWQLSTSPVLQVAKTGQPLIIPDALNQDQYPTFREDAELRNYRTVVVVPLETLDSEGRELVLSVQSREIIEVTDSELVFLQTVSRLTAVAVEKFLRLEQESRTADRLQKAVDTYSSLMEQALEERSLRGLGQTLAGLLRHPWIVVDLLSDEIITGPSPLPEHFDDTTWQSLVRNDLHNHICNLAHTATKSNFRHQWSLEVPLPKETTESAPSIRNCPAVSEPLLVEGETVGAIIILPGESGIDDLDFLIAQAARTALSAIAMSQFVGFRTLSASHGEIMHRLYSGDWQDPRDIRARAATLGLDLSPAAQLVMIAPKPGNAVQADDTVYRHHSISRLATRLLCAWTTTMEHGAYVARCPSDGLQGQKWATLKSQLLNDCRLILGHAPIIVRSAACQELSDYERAFDQCTRLVRLARALDLSGVVSESDFGSFSLLLSIADRDAAQQFLQTRIIPVAQHDATHNSDYLTSLKVFLEQEAAFKAAAGRLGIHVSTLRYRLERMRDLFQIDAMDQSARFDLQLAIRLYEIGRLTAEEA